MKESLIGLVMLASAATAGECPPVPDHSVDLARLVEEVRQARDAGAAQAVVGEMWTLWTDAPDDLAQAALDHGIYMRDRRDFAGALAEFDWLVGYCPDYAEGYNQRAFAHFLRRDFEAALPDLTRALELNPTHLGALSGRAMTLIALGREAEAQADLRVAVGLNPWLPERRLLQDTDGAPLAGESDL
ncbi:tetratricopeptide repeat protein [Marimonas arenosa]|uniref:Tetratricopeptide repeat protein n=1 Tax=Marimonas arenosa TaxID=1795305 RepID=A0AAE3WC42_9RHOB|nr:tetratricopeptide repeat protein [Marimonas arenosa]MDQ2090221.1 tetratricopeptide repeat protein [Marimonas arenosa]